MDEKLMKAIREALPELTATELSVFIQEAEENKKELERVSLKCEELQKKVDELSYLKSKESNYNERLSLLEERERQHTIDAAVF